jgi:hypothetical protein
MARLPDFAQGIVALDVGLRLGGQRQSLGRLYRRRVRWLPVDQAVQQVQDMGLRRGAGLQRQFDGGEHGLFVMLEDQGQNLDHLAVAARRLEHALLQSPEGGRQFDERRAVTQGSRLALNDREIVPPVVNRCGALPFVGAGKNAAMLAHDLPLGDDDDALGIHPQADRTIGERRRHAVAIAVQMDQARRRHALGVFDEAVERARKLHQAPDFFCPYVDDRARLRAVQRLGPQFEPACEYEGGD